MSGTACIPPDEELRLFFSLLERVGRSGGLSPEDQMDFTQGVHLKLLETDYALFRRFERQSSLKSYLSVVATRLLKDWKNHAWGKWRPSAAATRLGAHAVDLERLVVRDGLRPDEAVSSLRSRPDTPPTRDLRQLLDRLPPRHRRRLVAEDEIDEVAGPAFQDPVLARERDEKEERRRRAVRELLAKLPPEDRRLLEARYLEETRVPQMARSLGQDPKAVYRRCERLLLSLRHTLQEQGLGRTVPLPDRRRVTT